MINLQNCKSQTPVESYITSSVVSYLPLYSQTRGDGGISDGWATVELECGWYRKSAFTCNGQRARQFMLNQ